MNILKVFEGKSSKFIYISGMFLNFSSDTLRQIH